MPEHVESYKGPIGACIFSHEFYETDLSRSFVRGYQLQVGRQSGPVTVALGGLGTAGLLRAPPLPSS